MDTLYIILEKCIKSNTLDKLVKIILDNYKEIINIKNISYNYNLDKYNLSIYSKSDISEENIILMFRLVEKNYYRLINKNCNTILNYKDEIANNKSNNKYNVIITDNENNIKIFKSYLLIYYLNLKFNKSISYLGLDFEFNTKKVALMQINFEQPNLDLYNNSLIFMFNPNQLSHNWKLFFIQKILCNLNCYKILHGSDSLDIPYLYSELLFNNNKYIQKFTSRFIDTKFLCEYKYYVKNLNLGKCKIYHVLKDDGIITIRKYDELLKNEINMGPIYDIIINVNSMSKHLINYTLYDVLYLTHLVDNFKKIQNYSLIIEITQFIFLEKRKVTNNIPYDEINKINNFIFIYNNKKLRLNDIFKNIFSKFINSSILNNILKINYFKNTLTMLFKFIFFIEICKKFIVYSKISHNKIIYNKHIINYNIVNPSKLKDVIDKYKKYITDYIKEI
jgi:hypothetical protein